MILLPASFAAIQRQGVVFHSLEGTRLRLSLGLVTRPEDEALRAWLLPFIEESLSSVELYELISSSLNIPHSYADFSIDACFLSVIFTSGRLNV